MGYYLGAPGGGGFIYQNGRYTALKVPQTEITIVEGINNLGQIVGYYIGLKGVHHGFVWLNGKFTTINYPNVGESGSGIQLTGINDEGQIAGYVTLSVDQYQPFIATPSYFTGF